MPLGDHRGPIIACSTGGHYNSALAIVRLSGFKSLDDLKKFFTKKGIMTPAQAYLTYIIDPKTSQRMDRGMVTYFKAPASYTGEHMLELSVHGNVINVDRIIKLFCSRASFLLAHPGEFTYRALKNKKITLSQVEGLELLLGATSEFALSQGHDTLNGGISRAFVSLRESYIKLKAAVELFIDFSEDVGEAEGREEIEKAHRDCLNRVRRLARRGEGAGGIRCPRVVLAGPTNSGKSTLFNALLGEGRSIVSREEGTTRDYVDGVVDYRGVHYTLTDTAGWRKGGAVGQVEREGMARGRSLLEESFYKIFVLNPKNLGVGIPDGIDLLVLTHGDKVQGGSGFSEHATKIVQTGLWGGQVEVLSDNRDLGEVFFEDIHKKFQEKAAQSPYLIERQRILVDQIEEELKGLGGILNPIGDVALVAMAIETVGHKIHELIGVVSPEEVLDSVFSNFCIGK